MPPSTASSRSGIGTNLNRILRTTAILLFDKGEGLTDVQRFLYGVEPSHQVKEWYVRHRKINGVTEYKIRERRIPAPPIDFDKICLKNLEQLGKEKLENLSVVSKAVTDFEDFLEAQGEA